MLLFKFLLIAGGTVLLVGAAVLLEHNIFECVRARRRVEAAEAGPEKLPEKELRRRVQLAGMVCGAMVVGCLSVSSFNTVLVGHAGVIPAFPF